MEKAKSAGRAIIEQRCPRCREGKLFLGPAYGSFNFYKMKYQCEVCEQVFDPEPGFYFGAMYISYAFLVAISVTSWVFLHVVFKPSFTTYLVVILIANVLLLPLIFRYSRTLFLYGFGGIKYSNRK
jgi:uncharacterized protein (DUF983 family)